MNSVFWDEYVYMYKRGILIFTIMQCNKFQIKKKTLFLLHKSEISNIEWVNVKFHTTKLYSERDFEQMK